MKFFRKLYHTLRSRLIVKKHIDYPREKYNDRAVLENIIFPYVLARHNPKAILDIGREDYQSFYNEFFKGRELWTMDIDPESEIFGADNHIVDSASDIKQHFRDNYFDFILMNGVFGWGLDKEKDVQKAFNAIYDILKPGGMFILGWNDDIVPLDKIKGLIKLKPYYFKPLKGEKFLCTNGNHTYNFYIKSNANTANRE